MPYVHRKIPYAIMELKSENYGNITIDTTPSYITIGSLQLPSFRGTPQYMYIDTIISSRKDTSGGINYMKIGSLTTINKSGTRHTCAGLNLDSYTTPANTQVYNTVVIPGTENIAAYVISGEGLTIEIYATTQGDSLELYDLYCIGRIYFNTT